MMDNIWLASAVWIGLALASSLISIRLALSVALIEIIVGALGGNLIGLPLTPWVNYLAGLGAILLTFLAGAEVDMGGGAPQSRGEHRNRLRQFLVAISRLHAGRALCARLALAAGTDRGHFALHHFGGRGLRGHGGNRAQ